jgi:acyl transferase domain-containing protein
LREWEFSRLESILDKTYNKRQKIKFVDTCKAAIETGVKLLFLVVGPNSILSALVAKYSNSNLKCIPAMRTQIVDSEYEILIEAISQLSVQRVGFNWWNFYKGVGNLKMDLPFYPFQRKKYWFKKLNIEKGQGQIKGHILLGNEVDCPIKEPQIFRNILSVDSNDLEFTRRHSRIRGGKCDHDFSYMIDHDGLWGSPSHHMDICGVGKCRSQGAGSKRSGRTHLINEYQVGGR